MVTEKMSSSPSPIVAGGSTLYLGLSKQHRVSRTFRATWYLQHLCKPIPATTVAQQQGEGEEDQEVDILVLGGRGLGDIIGLDTQVFYICGQYSLVFVLDMSPNMHTVSNYTYSLKLDEAVESLCGCLTLLTDPFRVCGRESLCSPSLWITVLAYSGATEEKPIHVMLQGVHVGSGNCQPLVESLRRAINQHENHLASSHCRNLRSEPGGVSGGKSSGDVTLEGMVRAGTLGIQLLPRSALKGVVLLTDGISSFSSPSSMHNTVSSMSSSNVSCWVVQVGGASHPSDTLGLVPDIQTLNFMTRACNGCVIHPNKVTAALQRRHLPGPQQGDDAVSAERDSGPNPVQQAILLWTFQHCAYESRVRGVVGEGWEIQEDPFAPIIHASFSKGTVNASPLCVLGCKIREGFYLKEVQVKDVVLEMCLCYPWQPSVNIYYSIVAPWPLRDHTEPLHVTTSYDAPYLFVQDIQSEPTPPSGSARAAAVRKFKQALQKFSNSDALLAHFLAFSSSTALHTLPTSLQDGVPLFYHLPTAAKPTIAVNTPGGKSSSQHQFWRPLCTIDNSQWYRWFHSDKLVLILHPELPLPKNLLQQSANGRYGSPLCRPAASHLFSFLKGWSSLVLLEAHSYIRFLPSNSSPRYFCLVRVAQKHPCLVLHIGYIEGTPHHLQATTISSLIQSLRQLAPPTTGALGKRKSNVGVGTGGKGREVLTILSKQLQRVMIRYDSSAGGMGSLSGLGGMVGEATGEKLTQMEYLLQSSWRWRPPCSTPDILTALLKCRLQEGYHVTSADNGVVTLVAQLTLQQQNVAETQKLLLQYVIFPYSDSLHSELWVEPQYGVVSSTPPGLGYLQDLTYSDISAKVCAVDRALVTQVASFAHLLSSCEARDCTLPSEEDSGSSREVEGGVVLVEFQFSSLLEKSCVFAITIAAFSEAVPEGGASLALGQSSEVNQQFWESLYSRLCSLAPTQLQVSELTLLMQRLLESPGGMLRPLFALEGFEEAGGEGPWRCGVVNVEDSITVFLLAERFFFPSVKEGGTHGGRVLLPLLLLQVDHSRLMDFHQQEDFYLHFDLETQPPSLPSKVPSSTAVILSPLSSLHTSCYLQQVYSALSLRLPLAPQDFNKALELCHSTCLSVDATPLLAAHCKHTLVHLPSHPEPATPPLPCELLCAMLSAALSKRNWTCSLSCGDQGCSEEEAESHLTCSSRLLNQTFMHHLDELGFKEVSQCGPTYFWLNREMQLSAAESAMSLAAAPVSTSNPLHEGEGESSDEEQGMLLVPLLSPPSDDYTKQSSNDSAPSSPLPLFLRVQCAIRDRTGAHKKNISLSGCLPFCFKELGECCGEEHCTVSVELVFHCLSQAGAGQGQAGPDNQTGEVGVSSLPRCYHGIANTVQRYLQWLVADELVSVGRSLPLLTPALLQGVATHVQTTPSTIQSCVAQQVPLKFVLGEVSSSSHFAQQLEALELPGYLLHKCDEYYYLEPRPLAPSAVYRGELTPDILSSNSDTRLSSGQQVYAQSSEPAVERSRTPPPPQIVPAALKVHRRSMSSGQSNQLTSQLPHLLLASLQPGAHSNEQLPQFQVSSLQASAHGSELDVELATVEVSSVSGYEAGLSDDASSMVSDRPLLHHSHTAHQLSEGVEGRVWLVLRVLPGQVEVYFQLRSCEQHQMEEGVWSELRGVCNGLVSALEQSCHRTNQWLLMKDMLETHHCSPYLLSQSAPEAWVEEVVQQQGRHDTFRAQEFMCDLVHSFHITPHWRIKDMKAQAALLITRSALSAFAVSNRQDVYVLQDIKDTGEESIFYIKVDESLCNVEHSGSLDATPSLERRDTVDADETQSTFSYQHSVLSEVPEGEKRHANMLDLASLSAGGGAGGKPQESLVLQVYGLNRPSQEFRERLAGIIQNKLDTTTLDNMCSVFSRNQQLKLTAEDVEFLQPDRKPSHTLHLPLPECLPQHHRHPFLFYFLQTVSSFAVRPLYTPALQQKQHLQLHAHQELQNAYLVGGLQQEGHNDHMFLYIRPQTKGRGMAVLCVSLADGSGRVQAPLPGITQPHPLPDSDLLAGKQCVVSEEGVASGTWSLRVQVWEKGNIGLEEFMQKLSLCCQHTLLDYHLELSLLPCPVADPVPTMWEGVPLDKGVESPVFAGEQSPGRSLAAATQSPQKRGSLPSSKSSDSSEGISRKVSLQTQDSSRRESSDIKRPSALTSLSDSRRASSDSRQGSTVPAPSRRESSTEGRRGSGLSGDSRRGSGLSVFGSESSRRGSGAAGEGRRVSMGEGRKISVGVKVDGVIEEVEENCGSLDEDAQGQWLHREKARRVNEAMEMLVQEAELGRSGLLKDTYSTVIPRQLSLAHSRSSPSVHYLSVPLLGQYSLRGFLSHAAALLDTSCPDLTSDTFMWTPVGYRHCVLEKDWIKVDKTVTMHHLNTNFILISRDLTQWEKPVSTKPFPSESSKPGSTKPSPSESSLLQQLFQPLDSQKPPSSSSSLSHTPFLSLATLKTVFIPRRRLVFIKAAQQKGEVWLYNFTEQCSRQLLEQLKLLRDHDSTRAGLLHHMLAQKMGLYRHCMSEDVRPYSKLAVNHCSTVPDAVRVIKNVPPSSEPVKPLLTRRVAPYDPLAVETMYQEERPYGHVPQTQDPVYNHGQQLREWQTHRRREMERVHLLGKVFRSWLSREDASVPVSPDVMANLKRTARLLHYCTSPLLLQQSLAQPSVAQPSMVTEWVESIKEECMSLYIEYLSSLGFQIVNERVTTLKPGYGSSKTPPPPPPLYKCLQRSWSGGILMVELMFQHHHFLVKLYTLEGSRLPEASPSHSNLEAQSSFSRECARYKDFIHVHSFLHDFHLRILLQLLSNQRDVPTTFNLAHYLQECHSHYLPPPNFVQNLLKEETLRVPTSVAPKHLYLHLISHCKEFGTTTLELQLQPTSSTTSDPPSDIGLLINVSRDSLGPTTSPQLSQLMQENKAKYSIQVVAIFSPLDHSSDQVQYLQLVFYLLLVNKEEKFPYLTSPSQDHSASCHTLPPMGSQLEAEEEESALKLKVQEHRRKMGYGIHPTGSSTSLQVLYKDKVDSHISAVRTHLETVINTALHHMKKDELWKRLLYGALQPIEGKTLPAFMGLKYSDFRDLLHLVTVCSLESLDPRLTQLKKQPRKWFKKLIKALQLRFRENIRVYSSDDESHTYAAMINPDWQDMLVVVHSSSEARHQGISAVYRKQMERGGVPEQERDITAHVEADRQHIETIVNFCCSFMWASILDTAPPLPHINLL